MVSFEGGGQLLQCAGRLAKHWTHSCQGLLVYVCCCGNAIVTGRLPSKTLSQVQIKRKKRIKVGSREFGEDLGAMRDHHQLAMGPGVRHASRTVPVLARLLRAASTVHCHNGPFDPCWSWPLPCDPLQGAMTCSSK